MKLITNYALCVFLVFSTLIAEGTVNILINGASAIQGVMKDLPAIAAADGIDVHTELVMLDNASAITAMNAILAGSNSVYGYNVSNVTDVSIYDVHGYVRYANDRKTMVHLGDLIAERTWDAVVLSINTHLNVDRDVFKTVDSPFPYFYAKRTNYATTFEFKNNFFRNTNILPNTEYYIFQNLAPRNDCEYKIVKMEQKIRDRGYIAADEILTEDRWAEISSENFTICAEDLNFTPVFAGDILYWIRRDAAFGYLEASNHVVAAAIYNSTNGPDYLPPWTIENELRTNFKWRSLTNWVVDHHPNKDGNYMEGALAYEAIFKTNVVGNTYRPTTIPQDRIDVLQNLVHEISRDSNRYPLYRLEPPNPPTNATVIINNGDLQTTNFVVSLDLFAENPTPADMQISELPDFSDVGWINYQTNYIYTFGAPFGTKTIYAHFSDGGGGISETVSDTINLVPEPGMILWIVGMLECWNVGRKFK